MTTFQRVIKYIAIAFAAFLSFNIIVAICFGITIAIGVIDNITGDNFTNTSISKDISYSQAYENITELDVKLAASKLKILESNEFRVETTSNDIKIEQNGNILKIEEKFKFNNNISDVIIYIPNNILLNKFALDAGVGEVYIEKIIAQKMDLELGAGNIILKNVIVNEKTEINGGIGKVSIENAIFNNLDLDAGIGNFELEGQLLGDGKIDVGIGKLELGLQGEDYTIHAKKGLGQFTIDGKDVSDGTKTGEGTNRLSIDSGMGAVIVNFK